MPSPDRELLRLQEAEETARQLFARIVRGVRDPDFIRHAKDIWLEAQEALGRHENGKTAL